MADAQANRSSTKASPLASATILNVPNQLTIARLILSIICFVFLAFHWYGTALVLFAIAAGTDWIDGYWARKYGQVTQLGRILDPFADKIIICGTFIFLAAVPEPNRGPAASGIYAWMAVVVVGREILVTALRSFFEEHGTDFSANWPGKLKMVSQCLAVAVSLGRLWFYGYNPDVGNWDVAGGPVSWTTWILHATVWLAVAMTVYSGWVYVQSALKLLQAMQKRVSTDG